MSARAHAKYGKSGNCRVPNRIRNSLPDNSRARQRRTLRYELLEDRRLLAGNLLTLAFATDVRSPLNQLVQAPDASVRDEYHQRIKGLSGSTRLLDANPSGAGEGGMTMAVMNNGVLPAGIGASTFISAIGESAAPASVAIANDAQILYSPPRDSVASNTSPYTLGTRGSDWAIATVTATAALAHDSGSSAADGITSDDTINGKVTASTTVTTLKAGFDSTKASKFVDVSAALQPD